MSEKIIDKAKDKAVELIFVLLSLLLSTILPVILSQIDGKYTNTPQKKAIWAILILLIISMLLLLAYIHHIRKQLNTARGRIGIPNQTLTVIQRHEPSEYYWSLEKRNGKNTMYVSATFILTNHTDMNIRPSGATTKEGKGRGWVSVRLDDARMYDWCDIPARQQAFADVEIRIASPVKKEGEVFISDVAILDQFGNEHWIKDIEFTYGPQG